MRKLILSMMVSVDGYIEATDPTFNWHNWDDEMSEYMMGFFDTVDTFIYGRRSYEDMIDYWPQLNDPFARIMNDTPKYVFSRTLKEATWNATIIPELDAEEVRNWKQEKGKDMVLFAGADLADAMRKQQLIDEYRIIINPVLLGGGKPLFREQPLLEPLKLVSTRPFKGGNTLLVYHVS